jgi:hypothetical protein
MQNNQTIVIEAIATKAIEGLPVGDFYKYFKFPKHAGLHTYTQGLTREVITKPESTSFFEFSRTYVREQENGGLSVGTKETIERLARSVM